MVDFGSEEPAVTISLNVIERDTLLGAVKDLIEIKKQHAKTALTDNERNLIEAQAEMAQHLYDRIYSQKLKEPWPFK